MRYDGRSVHSWPHENIIFANMQACCKGGLAHAHPNYVKQIDCFNHRGVTLVAWLILVSEANFKEVFLLFPPLFLVPE